MASEVDICNLALSHLGDDATVSSINPPEGSAQAEHCATFYPIARDALLELHQWNFSTKRVSLALLNVTPPSTWQYVYAAPGDALNLISILAPDAGDDQSVALMTPSAASDLSPVLSQNSSYIANTSQGFYTPQPFEAEILADGTQVIYTNQANAVCRYTGQPTDPTTFSPLFIVGLSWLLAGMLAGPLLKGEAGRDARKDCEQEFGVWFSKATISDANSRRMQPQQSTPWMVGR
jgi:hypothetical protein